MALAVRGDGRWRPITVVSLAATVLFVTFLFLPWGNATFLMAVVTLFAWIAVIGVRLAPRIRFSTRAIVSKDPSPVLINSREPEESRAGSQVFRLRWHFVLRLRRSWTRWHFTLGSARCGDAESDADQKCRGAADATPGPGVVRQDQSGDQSQIEPHCAAQNSQDAPARPAAGGEYTG